MMAAHAASPMEVDPAGDAVDGLTMGQMVEQIRAQPVHCSLAEVRIKRSLAVSSSRSLLLAEAERHDFAARPGNSARQGFTGSRGGATPAVRVPGRGAATPVPLCDAWSQKVKKNASERHVVSTYGAA